MSDTLPCCGNDKVRILNATENNRWKIECSKCGAKFWQERPGGALTRIDAMTWQPIETVPHMKAVLIFYQRPFHDRTFGVIVKGIYYDKFAVESSEEESEYDEETDEYYTPEGWYEMIDNWDEYASCKLFPEHKPSHWMPLPEPPEVKP